jgi:hypothetical protein
MSWKRAYLRSINSDLFEFRAKNWMQRVALVCVSVRCYELANTRRRPRRNPCRTLRFEFGFVIQFYKHCPSCINLDFRAEIDFFWKSHFPACSSELLTTASRVDDEDDDQVDPTTIPDDADEIDDEDSSDHLAASSSTPIASSSLNLPRCKGKCIQRVPLEAAQDMRQIYGLLQHLLAAARPGNLRRGCEARF